jgi:hypothetical protein
MATRSSNTDDGTGLPTTVVDDLLAVENRRRALSILDRRDEPMVVERLATAVVADREDCPESDVARADRDAMCEELYTEHLPKLTATSVVEYDSMLGTVELARRIVD